MSEETGKAGAGGGLPLYVRLSERLIREIAAGHLPEGTRLPPEREMAAELGTSVGTLRKALADLAEKGLLERIQGSGNYVRHKPDVASVYAFFRLERIGGGGLPTAEILDVETFDAPPAEAEFKGGNQAHRIRRLRSLEGDAIALEEIWLDGAVAEDLDPGALSESLYLYYRDTLHLIIARVEDRIGVADVPGWTRPPFGPPSGTACGYIERQSWAHGAAPVEFSRTWFDTTKARYVSRMGKG